jgi:hypothetical protein
MKKLQYFVLITLIVGSTNVFAQLSDRVNSPSTFKVGTRPVMGNLGLYFGVSYNDIQDWIDSDMEYTGLPIVSLKYYSTDNNVWRIGFQSSTANKVLKGTIEGNLAGDMVEQKLVDNTSKLTFSPGYEHHFTSSNILDVYVGTLIPIGWDRQKWVVNETYNNSDYNNYSRMRTSITYGLEVFVGVQAFIADLPLALGLDFGAAALGHLNDKYKHQESTKVGASTTDQTYYTVDDTGVGIQYLTLNQRDYQLEGNIRFTITYFFKK